jgi:hypothetical protein
MLSCPNCGKAIPPGVDACRSCQPGAAWTENTIRAENNRYFRCENGHYYDHGKYSACPFCRRRSAPPWAILVAGAALLIGAGAFVAVHHARNSGARPGLPTALTGKHPGPKPSGPERRTPVPAMPDPRANEAGHPPASEHKAEPPMHKENVAPDPDIPQLPPRRTEIHQRKSSPTGSKSDNPENEPPLIKGGDKPYRQDKTGKQ